METIHYRNARRIIRGVYSRLDMTMEAKYNNLELDSEVAQHIADDLRMIELMRHSVPANQHKQLDRAESSLMEAVGGGADRSEFGLRSHISIMADVTKGLMALTNSNIGGPSLSLGL